MVNTHTGGENRVRYSICRDGEEELCKKCHTGLFDSNVVVGSDPIREEEDQEELATFRVTPQIEAEQVSELIPN